MKKLLALIPLALALSAGAPAADDFDAFLDGPVPSLLTDGQRMELERRAAMGDMAAKQYLVYIIEQELKLIKKYRNGLERRIKQREREEQREKEREQEARERELHRLEVRKREAELRQLTGQPADTGPPPARAQLAQQPARAQPAGPPAGRAHQMEPAGAHQ